MNSGIIPGSMSVRPLIEREKARIEAEYRPLLAACAPQNRAALLKQKEADIRRAVARLLEQRKGTARCIRILR
jgi:hypothetical protein